MIQLVRILLSTTFILDGWALTCLPTKVVSICENLIMLPDDSSKVSESFWNHPFKTSANFHDF